MRKEIEIYTTIGGGAIAGDSTDELAPLLKISFCNELASLTDDEKIAAVKGALRALGYHPVGKEREVVKEGSK